MVADGDERDDLVFLFIVKVEYICIISVEIGNRFPRFT